MDTVYIFQQYISQNILFWTFSTIAQSFVAFVALLGMVTIYRIQIIRRSIETVAKEMRNHLTNYRKSSITHENKKEGSAMTISTSEVYGYTTEKIIKDIKGLAETYPNDNVLKRANLEFSNLEKDIQNIKRLAKPFFSSIIFLLIFSLVLLTMSPALEYTLLGLLFLWLIIFWCLASFILGLNLLVGLL